jgi:hypothetical protein
MLVTANQQNVFETRVFRFWGLMFPATALFVAVQAVLSRFAFRAFSAKVDGVLRAAIGYGAIVLALSAVLLLVVVYLTQARQRFEILPAGLLIRQPGRAAVTMAWEELRVHQRHQQATFQEGRRRVSVHRFFLPELPRLCDLVELARRHKKERSYQDLQA